MFFEQLQTFSERVFAALGFAERISPWRDREFRNGSPVGAVLHFTAGSDPRRALRWFMQREFEAHASANVVVADGWPDDWREFSEGLDLVRALPAAVVQCVPPDRPSWHATWTNSFCYGIEMVNAGELRPAGEDQWAWWPDDWTREWRPWGVPKEPVPMYGRYWEPYTVQQILAVLEVLRQLQQYYGTLKRYMVVGHEQVTEHKIDPGPLFPIHGIRLALYEPDINPSAYQWFRNFSASVQDGKAWRDALVQDWHDQVIGGPIMAAADAWLAFGKVLRNQFLASKGEFGIVGKTAIQVLGYYMGRFVPELSAEERASIGMFQRMRGLKVDGDPGIRTRTALVSRLEERGILPAP